MSDLVHNRLRTMVKPLYVESLIMHYDIVYSTKPNHEMRDIVLNETKSLGLPKEMIYSIPKMWDRSISFEDDFSRRQNNIANLEIS